MSVRSKWCHRQTGSRLLSLAVFSGGGQGAGHEFDNIGDLLNIWWNILLPGSLTPRQLKYWNNNLIPNWLQNPPKPSESSGSSWAILWCISTIFFNRTHSCVFLPFCHLDGEIKEYSLSLINYSLGWYRTCLRWKCSKKIQVFWLQTLGVFSFYRFSPNRNCAKRRGWMSWRGERSLWRSLEEVRLFLFHRLSSTNGVQPPSNKNFTQWKPQLQL